MTISIQIYIYIAIAYLIGSISSAIIVCKIYNLPDPRKQGSNNPGATNVLRIAGKLPAILTLAGDLLKGVLPVYCARYFGLPPIVICLVFFAVLIGHLYPIYFQFKGGKGIATAIGGFIALSWQFGGAVVFSWILGFAFSRISSVGAITMSLSAPVYAWLIFSDPVYFYMTVIVSIILLIKHQSNIKRLVQGTEGRKKNPKN